ncbi:HNH endonuclease [Agromyces sp. Root1464]|uniref:HNH endonuclease n=1 Tax=Agromyces sp. Root1464 TaxID=1736467 RepID=UPI000B01FD94|nr:HNH endonuclease [Agromyces sp. Root1464]
MAVIAIYLQSNGLGQQNLEFAVRTRRWGFTKWRPNYAEIEPRTLVLIGTGFSHPTAGASPRKSVDIWAQGALARIMVFRAESSIRTEGLLHWPDEVANQAVKYPFRFDVTPLRELGPVEFDALPTDLVEAFRLSALKQGGGEVVPDSSFTSALVKGTTPDTLTTPLTDWPKDAGYGTFVAPIDVEVAARQLAGGPAVEEFVLWRAAGDSSTISPVGPGEPIIMATTGSSSSHRIAVGGGLFSGRSRMTLSELWEWFGAASGARSPAELRTAYEQLVARPLNANEDPDVDTTLLHHVRFFSPDEYVDLAIDPTVFTFEQGNYFDLSNRAPEDPVLRAIITYFDPRQDPHADEVAQIVLGTIRAAARSVIPRLGQGAFRAMVSDAYGHQCALTGYRVRPVLEAAHIRAYSSGGEHRLDNGLLLRSDVHTLYDRGYISFDDVGGLMVSNQLRERFGNGDWYYDRIGMPLASPKRAVDQPHPDFLSWHRESVFLGV